MEESFLSFSCPACHNNIFEATVLRFGFVQHTSCPYCGTPVRWARSSLSALVIAVLIGGAAIFCIQNEINFFGLGAIATSIAIGISAVSFLLGIILIRFDKVLRSAEDYVSRTRLLYPNS